MGNLFARFRHRDVRIILLGLDSAGKTTILYRLKLDELVTTVPTIGFNVESVQYKDLHLTAWDIGSRDKIRPLFRHYYKGADAVVFVIDSHDRERLDELNYDVIKPAINAEELMNAVFLFLANKADLSDTMSTDEISDKLGLRFLKHPWGILPVSAVSGEGLQAALEWLAVRLGSAQVKPRNFTAVQPKPKLLQQCRTESSLSSSSSTATSKTDTSKPNSKVSIPPKPVILVNSKLYMDTKTTPTVSSGSMDNASLMSVSTPGSCYSSYVPRRSPGSVMNTFSSYSIAQSMRDDVSRRKFSTISRSDIRKMSCASLVESRDDRKLSICSLLDSPNQRKMSSVSLADSPYMRKMSSSFVIDAPAYRKFSSASLIDAAYARKMSACSLGDGKIPESMYARKLSATSLGEPHMMASANARKLSNVSLGDSQDEPEKPKMSYLMATPVDVATPPTAKRKSVDLAGFGKFTPIMADYINNESKDSDTSCDSLNLAIPSDHTQPLQKHLDLKKPTPTSVSLKHVYNTIEAMKEQHYEEILSLLPESYTNLNYRDYFSEPIDRRFAAERNQNLLTTLDDDDDNNDNVTNDGNASDNKYSSETNQVYNSENIPETKHLFKSTRQTSCESDCSAASDNSRGRKPHFILLCTPTRKSNSSNRTRRHSKDRSSVIVSTPKAAYCSRAYSAFRCLFLRSNKEKIRKETNSISSDEETGRMREKKETKVSFDLENHNIKVEVVDTDQE